MGISNLRYLPFYNTWIEKVKLAPSLVLLESEHGTGLGTKINKLIQTLYRSEHLSYKLIVSVTKDHKDQIKNTLDSLGITGITYVISKSLSYYSYLAKAKYLISDTALTKQYVKKDGQILLLIHDDKTDSAIDGNVFRNFMAADFLWFADSDTEQHAIKTYHLNTLSGKCILREGYDNCDEENTALRICRRVFQDETIDSEYYMPEHNKKNVLLYAGDFQKNGITTALLSMLTYLDKDKYNYFISYRLKYVKKLPQKLEMMKDEITLLPLVSEMNLDPLSAVAHLIFFKCKRSPKWVSRRLDQCYKRELKKHYPNQEMFHSVVHYNGYERYIIALYQRFVCKKILWTHNDVMKEVYQKKILNPHQLHEAYDQYDKIIAVSPSVQKSIEKFGGSIKKTYVLENFHDYQHVIARASEDLVFDEGMQSSISREALIDILNSTAVKFIGIGRYAVEKGQERLIQAFERFSLTHEDAYLIIVGGNGELYEHILTLAKNSPHAERIILLKDVDNPFPILKKCDLLLLSSFYEGLGLVLLEADTLKIPVVSTDIEGPDELLKKYGGTLVENSMDGLLKGMELFMQGQIKVMDIDYEETNRRSVLAYENIIE